ncbi:MAG: DUF378 domain-containing protein [Phycisphaerales bacterium]
MKPLDVLTLILTIVGGLNWGVYGVSRLAGGAFDLVSDTVGAASPALANLVFIVVGLSALYQLLALKRLALAGAGRVRTA